MFRAGALILIAVLLTAAAAIPLQKPSTQTGQQNAAQEQRGTENSPVVVKVLPTEPTQEQLAREDAQNKEKAAVDARLIALTGDLALYTKLLFVATAVLAILTLGLVRVGFLQVRDAKASIAAAVSAAETAKKQVEFARADFIASHSPRIIIRNVQLGIFKVGEIPTVSFRAINVGKTWARVVEVNSVAILGKLEEVPAYNDNETTEGKIQLVPGASHTFEARGRSPVPEGTELNRRNLGDRSFYVYGFVKYRDRRGMVWETGFGRVIEPELHTFRALGDEYEYQY
jgi:hypothetical protein